MQAKLPNEIANAAEIKPALTEKEGTLFVSVYLQPNASKTEIAGMHGDALKVRVAAPAVDNAANNACLAFFSKRFNLPKSQVWIHSGKTSRRKVIALQGLTTAQFLECVGSR